MPFSANPSAPCTFFVNTTNTVDTIAARVGSKGFSSMALRQVKLSQQKGFQVYKKVLINIYFSFKMTWLPFIVRKWAKKKELTWASSGQMMEHMYSGNAVYFQKCCFWTRLHTTLKQRSACVLLWLCDVRLVLSILNQAFIKRTHQPPVGVAELLSVIYLY